MRREYQISLEIARYFVKTIWICYQVALGIILILSAYFVFWAADYVNWFDIRSLRKHSPERTSFMRIEKTRIQHDSLLLGKVEAERKRKGVKELIWYKWLPWDSIPEKIRDLVIIAEDGKFFQHNGFDIEQIEYAMVSNHQKRKKMRGASTISQQVVKNLYLSGDKDYARKIKEAFMTVLLEHYLSKQRILEIYINIAQFGPGVFGIQSASLYYYNKPVGELAFNEALSLVALLPNPLRWHPRSRSLAFIRHRLRITKNLDLYKNIRRKIPDDVYRSYLEYATAEENIRWSELRDRERNAVSFSDSARQNMIRDSITIRKGRNNKDSDSF